MQTLKRIKNIYEKIRCIFMRLGYCSRSEARLFLRLNTVLVKNERVLIQVQK